jgi:hypothetical protein
VYPTIVNTLFRTKRLLVFATTCSIWVHCLSSLCLLNSLLSPASLDVPTGSQARVAPLTKLTSRWEIHEARGAHLSHEVSVAGGRYPEHQAGGDPQLTIPHGSLEGQRIHTGHRHASHLERLPGNRCSRLVVGAGFSRHIPNRRSKSEGTCLVLFPATQVRRMWSSGRLHK